MNTVQQVSPRVNPQFISIPAAWVSVGQQPGGVWVWRIERTDGRLGTTSRERFASFDEAADAATRVAECKGLPLAADVRMAVEMDSPFYSGHEHEMEVA